MRAVHGASSFRESVEGHGSIGARSFTSKSFDPRAGPEATRPRRLPRAAAL